MDGTHLQELSESRYVFRETKTAISPSKPKAIRQGHTNLPFLGLIRRIVAIEFIRQTFEVYRRGHRILERSISIYIYIYVGRLGVTNPNHTTLTS